MAVKADSVTASSVYQALNIVLANDVWVGFGRTTSWGSGEPVPDINKSAQTVEEIQAYKKAETLSLVVPDANGSIEFQGQKYRTVTADKAAALAAGARYVYVAVWLRYNEVPVVTFRQAGAFHQLKKTAGAAAKLIVVPAEVTDPGWLLGLQNSSPVTREATGKELVEFVLEF